MKASLIAIALAVFAVGCGSGSTGGIGQHKENDIGGTHEDKPADPQAYATACSLVDQALRYHDAAHRAPMLAAVRKLNQNPKTTAESFFLGGAVVVIEAEGIPNNEYSPDNKTTVIDGCKKAGHPLKNLA
jgi:hypothetical protein